jgi:A/G-specific adenine glycosylase
MVLKIKVNIQTELVKWYCVHKRNLPWRNTSDPYKIWVSEVMLQQTQVNTAIPYYYKFIKAFSNIKELACEDQQQVLKLWEGLGYYARARNLHKAAQIVEKEYNGKIPQGFDTFLKLPGVGEYIASAVQSIAFSKCHAVVDGNVKRVLSRLFLLNEPVNRPASYGSYKSVAQDLLVQSDPGDFNQAMMELGALICKPRTPECRVCPVQSYCEACKKNKTDIYPVKIKKKKVPTYKITAGVVIKDRKLLITRRKPEGLLGGLWEFPGGKIKEGEAPFAACVREILEETGVEARIKEHLTSVKHAYTHFKIQMDVFLCDFHKGKIILNGPIDYKWVTIDQIDDYAFPKANLKFFKVLKNTVKKDNVDMCLCVH